MQSMLKIVNTDKIQKEKDQKEKFMTSTKEYV